MACMHIRVGVQARLAWRMWTNSLSMAHMHHWHGTFGIAYMRNWHGTFGMAYMHVWHGIHAHLAWHTCTFDDVHAHLAWHTCTTGMARLAWHTHTFGTAHRHRRPPTCQVAPWLATPKVAVTLPPHQTLFWPLRFCPGLF